MSALRLRVELPTPDRHFANWEFKAEAKGPLSGRSSRLGENHKLRDFVVLHYDSFIFTDAYSASMNTARETSAFGNDRTG
jgi:hypothetical protein